MLIATHNGEFHADDVFGAALLKILFPEAKLLRSRNEAELRKADVVFDVGAVYDPAIKRFDHHQQGAPKRPNGITYSAFGLLWREYGLRYCEGHKELWRRIDDELVQFVDARDNGNELYELNDLQVVPVTVSDLLSLLNPLAGDENEGFDSQFDEAVELATRFLERKKAKVKARLADEERFGNAYENTPDERYVILDSYMKVVGIAEQYPALLYVVYPEEANDQWMLMTVRVSLARFETRKPLPAEWASLRNEELAAITNVADSVFCHTQRFVAGARSKEGVMNLLKLALSR